MRPRKSALAVRTIKRKKNGPPLTLADDLARKSTKLINSAKSESKDLSDYQEVESEYPGIKKYLKEDNGRSHEVWVDTRYHVNTYILHGNEEDKRNGLLGTDGTAVVKLFEKKSYDYLKVDDYIDRLNILYESSQNYIKESRDLSPQMKNKLNNFLEDSRKETIEQIRRECNFDGIKDKVRQNPEIVDKKLKRAVGIIRRNLASITGSIADTKTLSGKKTSFKEILDDIKKSEIKYIRERGRPFIIKTGEIVSEENMVSMQFPLGNQTIPSSDRTGLHETKLSNYVRDATGRIIDGKVEILNVIEGHSSYPPIGQKNEMERRRIAIESANEKIKQIAADLVRLNHNERPIKINLSTMMMLTPAIGKHEKHIRGMESEHGQLADTRYALEVIRNQSPYQIEIDGEPVEVEVDISFMNYPVNIGEKMQKMLKDEMQKNINNRGFYEFSEQMFNHANKMEIKNGHYENIPDIISDLNAYYAKTRSPIGHRLDKIHTDLKEEYKSLYQGIEAADARKYDKSRKNILSLQEKSYKRYNSAVDNQHKNYKKAVKNKSRIELINNINRKLKNKKLTRREKNALFSHLHFLKSEDIFYNKDFLSKSNAYQYHINYLLANQGIGREIEGFCKSAEDRTGWLRTALMGTIAFEEATGRLPDLSDNNDRQLYNKFTANSLELSSSIENTKYNSEARSLQVSGAFTNPDFNIDSGKSVSQIAKSIFNDPDELERYYEIQPNKVESKFLKLRRPTRIKSTLDLMRKIKQTTSDRFKTSSISYGEEKNSTSVSPDAISRKFEIPDKVTKEDILDNGKLLSDSFIDSVRTSLGERGINKPIRLTKNDILDLLRNDDNNETNAQILNRLKLDQIPYSMMALPGAPGRPPKLIAIYRGKKQGRKLGEGTSGIVKLAQDLDTGEFYALKTQTVTSERIRGQQEYEMNILKKVGLGIAQINYKREKVEKDPGGNIQLGTQEINASLLKLAPGEEISNQMTAKMTPEEILNLMIKAVDEIDALHRKNLLHRDLKPENMMYDPSSGKLTLIDFGSAAEMEKDSIQLQYRSTPTLSHKEHRQRCLELIKARSEIREINTEIDEINNKLKSEKSQLVKKELRNEKNKLNIRKDALSEPVTYTKQSDIYSLGITLGIISGLEKINRSYQNKEDLAHYIIEDSEKCPFDESTKASILNVLNEMTADPLSDQIDLKDIARNLTEIRNKMRNDAQLSTETEPDNRPRLNR